ncbi:hypothetical protein F5Y15DRAFT_428202 [Xylariaceae sp. FL0016]|nr:hypothetical protein F5Y15DRAFT_428202 [Xylariaceae sp. FL0016]
MTRPQIIRADSIDLQDHDSPSAKEHPTSIKANGSLAPHQAETIREVEEERAEESARSPRVSWANGDNDLQQYAEDLSNGIANSINSDKMQQHDALAIAQNGGVADDGDTDGDTDDGLDDDMMDKISSSPSIEDGGYPPGPVWPARTSSLRNSCQSQCDPPSSPVTSESRSLSPYLESPGYRRPTRTGEQASKATADELRSEQHHPVGEYPGHDEKDRPGKASDGINNIVNAHNDNDGVYDSDGFLLPSPLRPGNGFGGIQLDPNTVPSHYTDELYKQVFPGNRNRDSGVDMKVEDFSIDRPASAPSEQEVDSDTWPRSLYDLHDTAVEKDKDDYTELSLIDDSRFTDSGWGGECLQKIEDIDFEFVYALHTFVATVEGQANATKGDTMVLLDDSNSYWWLVRVVKDSSIGYLPAEHIETPTERLARLNKHRNIDLSATMLGDQAEKIKNPIMTAMRRRKAKTVTFTAPTFVDYSDYDYSSDEEGGEGDGQPQQQAAQQEQQAVAEKVASEATEEDESAKVEPLKPRTQKQVKLDVSEEAEEAKTVAENETRRNSDDMFDGKSERTTRNGTVRNTDSFFKDETIETKKITLTPGLLRDDNEPRISNDSNSLRQRPSFEKDFMSDKSKDDKKRKEKDRKEKDKKPSAIRSFFSRKDKKKSLDDDDESFGKRSMDAGTGLSEKEMVEEPESMEMDGSPDKGPQRNPSKLQKQQPRTEPSPTRKPSISQPANLDRAPILAADVKTNNVANVPPATLRMVESEQPEVQEKQPQKTEQLKSAISKVLPSSSSEPRPPKVTKAKSRVELDDFDSPEEDEEPPEPTRAPPAPQRQLSEDKPLRPNLPGAFPDSYLGTPTPLSQPNEPFSMQRPIEERPSESPIQVSPMTPNGPPGLMIDTSSQEDRSSPVSSPSPDAEDAERTHRNQDSMTSTSATTTSTWNDANLRTFFDSGSEIRDLLTVVYDKTDVAPAGPEHPVIGSLYRAENAKLAEITTVRYFQIIKNA